MTDKTVVVVLLEKKTLARACERRLAMLQGLQAEGIAER